MNQAVYVTNTAGSVTLLSRGCATFAGSTPRIGQDRWCVTWRLRTSDGELLPHDRCPMAVCIRERRPIRGVEAVAERPDGTYVEFRPYPTPLFASSGTFIGAINLLLDVSTHRKAEALRNRAAKCRLLVHLMPGSGKISPMADLAADYDYQALRIESTRPVADKWGPRRRES